MSSVNLLKYVADLLEEKQKLYEQKKQLQIDGDADQQPLEEQHRVACDISAIKDEHSTDNIVPDCADESSDKLTGLKDSISRDLSSFDDIQFDHVKVPLRDSLDTDLMTVLSETLDKIDNALGLSHSTNIDTSDIQCQCNNSTTIHNHVRICLVHCAKGASRSASIVIGYLLSRYPDEFPSFDDALGHVRRVRPHALPNVRFAVDLRKYAKDIHK
jgi:hypothetical protein